MIKFLNLFRSSATKEAVKDASIKYINNKSESLRSKWEITSFDDSFLNENVQSMKLCETTNEDDLKVLIKIILKLRNHLIS